MMLRVRVWFRRRLKQLLLIAVLTGGIAGLVMGLASGTRRTDSAPDRYTTWAGGDFDLVITQQQGAPLTDSIAALPGVAEAGSIVFVPSFLVSPVDGSPVVEPNPFAGDDRLNGTRVVAGRFTDPATPDEFTVNQPFFHMLADRFGTKVGEQFQVTSFDQDQLASNRAFDAGEAPAVPLFTATLVGITEAPDEFDDPSPTMTFSSSFLAAHPTVGVVETLTAVHVEPGVDPSTVMNAVHTLPNGGDAYPVPARIISDDARRAVRFQVTALWLVTGIALIAAVVVIAQLVGRMLRIPDEEGSSLVAVGWSRRDLAIERAIEGCVVAVIAAPVAAIVGFGLTAAFPLGVLRSFEPDTGRRLDWAVTLLGIAAMLVVVVAVAVVAGRHRSGRAAGRQHAGTFAGLLTASGAGMSLATGAHLAVAGPTGNRRPLGSLASGAIGLAGLVAAGVVGLSVTNIVDRPARWGVNYDALFGNPYIPTEDDIVAPIVDNPDVAALTAVNIGSLTINGRDTATLAIDAVKGGLLPPTLDGRPPTADDEIGLGAEVARQLGVHVGDHVQAVGPDGTAQDVEVVGIVVTPDSAGNGAAMTFDGYAALNPTATENVLLVNFRDGAPADAADAIGAANYSPPDALTTPTSIRALERVTAAPYVLVAVLTALLLIACAYLLTTSVRARGRDLGVLRSLGANGRQLRAIVHWQATTVAALVLLVGLPSGVILGRWVVELLTDALGIVPGAQVPTLLVLALVVAVGLSANVLALVPARRAARTNLVWLMRDR